MRILVDPPKRLINLAKHNLDLESVTEDFFDQALVTPTRQGRFMALGKIDGRTVAVIFKPLGTEAFSVISVRPASRAERQRL